MAIPTAPQITALQAQAAANLFLSDHLPDRFTADQPKLIAAEHSWQVPIILAYPGIGSLGCVGYVTIGATQEKVISHTPLAEVKQKAQRLYDTHHDAIQAAFL